MKNYRNIGKLFKLSKPQKMGDKLLVMATAPSTALFFEKESVRKQFEGYDLAFLNKMLLVSEREAHMYKPKYFIFMDDIFFAEKLNDGTVNKRRKDVEEALERVDWECYVVIPVLAELNVKNPLVKYIRIGIFSKGYKAPYKSLYRRNIFNPGYNTVVMGAIYYGITFGYDDIAILGFSYRPGYIYMDEYGLHVEDYMHYYDTEKSAEHIPFEEIMQNGESFMLRRSKRAVESSRILCDLALYAREMGTDVINYTPDNMVDVFRAGKLSL